MQIVAQGYGDDDIAQVGAEHLRDDGDLDGRKWVFAGHPWGPIIGWTHLALGYRGEHRLSYSKCSG